MNKILVIVAILCALCACKSSNGVVTQEVAKTTIETKYEVIRVPDTIYVDVPLQTSSIVTRDTTSILENDYAISKASVDSSGFLHHYLATKSGKRPVPTEKEIIRKDSVVFVDNIIKVPTPVERKLTWSEAISVKWFWWLAAAFVALVCWVARKPLLSVIRRFI